MPDTKREMEKHRPSDGHPAAKERHRSTPGFSGSETATSSGNIDGTETPSSDPAPGPVIKTLIGTKGP